jgi:hypothetical protein
VVEASAISSVTGHDVEVVTDAGDVVRMEASLIVNNLGGTPNTELFADALGVGLDGHLRSRPARDELPFAAALDFFRTAR